MNFWDSWQSPMVQFHLHGRTTRTKELGEVRDVSVSIPEGFPLQDACALLPEMGLSIKESIVMLLLSIYADIITLCKESIRIYLQSAKQYLLNTFQTLNKV